MRNYSTLSLAMPILLILSAVCFLSCSKSKPNRANIEKHCYAKVMESFKTRPPSLIERKFFIDARVRGILKAEQLKATEFAEGDSSATAANYIQEFAFFDGQGKKIKLVRSPETGGISMTKANIVTPHIQCSVVWGMFKGKVLKDRLKTILVKVDGLEQKYKILDPMLK